MNAKAVFNDLFGIISLFCNKIPWSVPVILAGIMVAGTMAAKDAAPWKDKYQEVGDIKIHYLEAGSGSSSLILLSGWTLPAEIWREQIPYFASRGFKVVAIDARSHGLSAKSEGGNTYHQQAADLHAFLESLNLEHSYMIGWGAGATVLLEYISSPESVRPEKMVLVDCIPYYPKADDYPGAPLTVQQARRLLLGYQEDRAKAAGQFIRSLFQSSPPEYLAKSLTESSLRTPMAAAASLFFDLYTGDRRPALLHISVPSLIVSSPENRAVAEHLQSKIQRAELQVIQDAGTAMFFEKPQAFNQMVESFFGVH